MKDRYLDIDASAPKLTREEFAAYWLTPDQYGVPALAYYEEELYESVAQYRSECGLYGDAGPGQALRIGQGRAELARIRRLLGI